MSEIKVNKVSPATGTAIQLGDSGDTFTVPSGATIVNSGTATGFGTAGADTDLSNLSATGEKLVCQAWVTFDQKTTAMNVEDSGGNTGVSSVTDMGTGRFKVTFSSAMTNATYAITGVVDYGSATNAHLMVVGYEDSSEPSDQTTTLFYGATVYGSTRQDCQYVSVMVFGD